MSFLPGLWRTWINRSAAGPFLNADSLNDWEAKFRALDCLGAVRALALVDALPGSPADGDAYLTSATATPANKLVRRFGSTWETFTPPNGMVAWLPDGSAKQFLSGVWGDSAVVGHTHTASDVTSGVFDAARIPALPTSRITGLDTALAGKSGTGHTHPYLLISNPEFTGALSQSGVERITSGGEARIIGARISGLSQNALPRVADANKQLGDSAFADDGTQATISRSLMVLSGPNPMFKLDSKNGNDFYIQSTATALKIVSQANSSGHIEFFPAQSLILRLTTQGVSQFPVDYDLSDGDLFGVVELQPRKDSYTDGAIAATGRIWNSGERQALSIFDGAAASPYRGRIRADRWFAYSTLIIQNKTVHTSWFAGGTGDGSATIPANYLKKGRRVHIHGRVLCSSCAASSAPEITLTIGAHTIWTQAKTLAVAAGHDVVVEFWVDAYLDSGGVLNALGRIEFSSWGIDSPHIYKFGTAITSFDPTTAKLVDCTLKPSSASEIWVRSIARVEA